MDIARNARKLARHLKRQNRHRSWRQIAREDYNNQISHATLNQIANDDGAYYPADEDLQILLGLKRPRKPRTHKPLPLIDMTCDAIRAAFSNRQEIPAPDRRVLLAFVRAGLLKRTWITHQ